MKYCVYFCLDKNSNAVKIGKSSKKRLSERLGKLQTGNPNTLEIINVIEFLTEDAAFAYEAGLHHKYADIRLRENGEWFRYTSEFKNLTYGNASSNDRVYSIQTIYGVENFFDAADKYRCFFYPYLLASRDKSVPLSFKNKIPFRTMIYPTNGKKLVLPFSDECDRVFISKRKYNELGLLKSFLEKKNNNNINLETFFD